MNNADARFLKSKYARLSELGSRHNLSFSSHLLLGNKIIALDGRRKALLVSEDTLLFKSVIIDLYTIETISIKRVYTGIRAGELSEKPFEEFLEKVELHFKYINSDDTYSLPFYNSAYDPIQFLPRLERNARNWQMILSKMIASSSASRAKGRNTISMAD